MLHDAAKPVQITTIPEADTYTTSVDMGLIWRMVAPSIEDREKCTISTLGEDYREDAVNTVLRRHKHADRIICAYDPYDQQLCIKNSERLEECSNQQ